MLGLSVMTAYETGLVRAIPMPVHLAMDAVMGVLLAASPWIFGFDDVVYLPFLVLGIAELAAAATTETRTGHRLTHTAL
jgi:hypothetical protein